jgi:hypothetical protein
VALALVGAVVTVLGAALSRDTAVVTQPLNVKDYTRALQDCTDNANRSMNTVREDFDTFRQIWTTCGNQIYLVDLMEDFDIRREKLIRQELDERVILWMVVGITMSGVFLAGLQLLASYRLAVAGTGKLGDTSNIALETGMDTHKITVQSSVTGLMILVVSLAFFIVYVKWIYTIQEISIEKPQSLSQTSGSGKIVGYGSLGSAPALASGPAMPTFAGPTPSAAASAPGTPAANSNKAPVRK